ncbi:hypothetical protein [Streptomyces phaeoluteigriseus]
MASQKKPPVPHGPDGTGGATVRRAVSLGSAAADPGAMLAPAARRTPAPEPGEGGTGEAETARPAPHTPDTAESGASSEPPATTAGTRGEPAASAATAATATASASAERPEAESESASEPAAAVRAAPAAGARGVGATATAGTAAAATATAAPAAAGAGADEPPSGNPKKPLLAAAGIAGVVLLAVPLLIWATDDSREKKDNVAVAAGSDTLLDEEPMEVPKGDYAPAEPTPEPSTEKPSAKPRPVVKKADPAPSSEPAPASKRAEKPKKAETQVEEYDPPKLPPNTAAYAVQRLAASNPGRHICYRVHVKGAGWTAPVCDGATAGKEGGGRPITAINVSVADATRVNGNEFIQKDGWTTAWSSAPDGTDLVLGSAASNAPSLSGFTIGVVSGNVCQNHKLGDRGWGGLACEKPEGWIFGGSTEPQFWLEAVRFTV